MGFTVPSDMLLPVRLTSIAYAARDALLFEFTTLAGALPPVQAGAHIDLHLPAGQRQYSLVTPLCTTQRYVVAVKREAAGRGGSVWLHDEARVGASFQLGHPRNNCALDEAADATLLLAGGIGITPIYAMFARLQDLGRPVRLHYWSRSAEHALFLYRLRGHPDATLHYPSAAGRTSVAAVLQAAGPRTAIYCCGPARMLDDCTASVPDAAQLHLERFAPAPAAPGGDVGAFIVHLARTGRDVLVAPGETILGALIAEGVDVSYSCEEGVCCACETRLLEGTPLHRDSDRSPEDHARLGTVMICCSRSRAPRLELDL